MIEPRQLNIEHLTVQKQQRAQAWLFVELGILRSVASIVRKASTCGAPMSRGCFHRAVAAMPAHEKPNPIQVNLLNTEATVHISNLLPNLVKQPDGLQRRGSGFHGYFYNCIKIRAIHLAPQPSDVLAEL